MNGKISKRIHLAARITSTTETYRKRIKQLKREYKITPYFKRLARLRVSHSKILRLHHGADFYENSNE